MVSSIGLVVRPFPAVVIVQHAGKGLEALPGVLVYCLLEFRTGCGSTASSFEVRGNCAIVCRCDI